MTSIGSLDAWKLRFWREYFSQFSECVSKEDDGLASSYLPDAEKQLDSALEEEIDQQILLQSLLQRSSKQLEIASQLSIQRAVSAQAQWQQEGSEDGQGQAQESENVEEQKDEVEERFDGQAEFELEDEESLFKDLLVNDEAVDIVGLDEQANDRLSELLEQ